MKQLHFFSILCALTIFASCNKELKVEGPIGDYIAKHELKNVQMLVDSSGQDTMYYVITEKGNGPKVSTGDHISVHYTGKLVSNDSTFDSSIPRKEPFKISVGAGKVIKGWDQGLQVFQKGSKGKLLIPSKMGYGNRGAGPIPGGADLMFDIELIDIIDPVVYEKELAERSKVVNKKFADRIAQIAGQNFADQIAIDKPLLEAYAKKNNLEFITTPSGIMIVIEEKGSGMTPIAGESLVDVHYTGKTLDGNIFDTSLGKGRPFTVLVGGGRVIPGWDEGLLHFQQGGKGKLLIPSSLAYGVQGGGGGAIPPNSPLIFDVEIVGVK